MAARLSVYDASQGLPLKSGPKKRRPWTFGVIGAILAICAIAIPIAVVFSSRSDGHSVATSKSSASSASSNSRKLGPNSLVAKKKWNFDTDKVIGINLGNWLVLERWMAEDWFVEKAGPDSWDEWTYSIAQGANASRSLEEHWDTWVTEADVDKLHGAGINTFRVPVPFWMFIGTVSPEPYVTTGQLDYLERLCGWAYARDMYLIIDLHALPGSQNGEQQSGHNTTNPTFYQPAQQARADQTVKAVVDWVAQSAYYSIISAIEVANEPRPYTTEQRAMLRGYYERSYQTIQTLGDKAPAMFFADGYVPGDKLAYWWDFAKAHQTSPPSLLFTDHPYPGYFPAQNNSADILNQTCVKGNKYANFPVPTIITEWSLRTGIQNATFEKIYYEAQLAAWSVHSGGLFWSLRALESKIAVLADKKAQYQWSFEALLERGSITLPSTPAASPAQFISELHTSCGAPPALTRDGSPPQGTEAAAAIADAAAAKAMLDNITKSIAQAADSLGLAGIGPNAVKKSPSKSTH